MSQSSTSSANSKSNRIKKRRISESSSDKILSVPKKRSSRLSLKPDVFKKWIPASHHLLMNEQSSNDGSTSSSCSFNINTSVRNSSNIVPNYAAVAKEFNISVVSAKKYFTVLKIKPKVNLFLIDPNRLDIKEQPAEAVIPGPPVSPVISFKTKRKRKKLLQVKDEPVDLPPLDDTSGKAFSVENYLNSCSQQVSQVNSPNSFEKSNSLNTREKIQDSTQNIKIVPNPFSKRKPKRKKTKANNAENIEYMQNLVENEISQEKGKRNSFQKIQQLNPVTSVAEKSDDSMSVNFDAFFGAYNTEVGTNVGQNQPISFGNTSVSLNYQTKNCIPYGKDQNQVSAIGEVGKNSQMDCDSVDDQNHKNSDAEACLVKSFSISDLFSQADVDYSMPEKTTISNSVSRDECTSKAKSTVQIESVSKLPKNSITLSESEVVNIEDTLLSTKVAGVEAFVCNGLDERNITDCELAMIQSKTTATNCVLNAKVMTDETSPIESVHGNNDKIHQDPAELLNAQGNSFSHGVSINNLNANCEYELLETKNLNMGKHSSSENRSTSNTNEPEKKNVDNSVKESFESICEDLAQMTDSENPLVQKDCNPETEVEVVQEIESTSGNDVSSQQSQSILSLTRSSRKSLSTKPSSERSVSPVISRRRSLKTVSTTPSSARSVSPVISRKRCQKTVSTTQTRKRSLRIQNSLEIGSQSAVPPNNNSNLNETVSPVESVITEKIVNSSQTISPAKSSSTVLAKKNDEWDFIMPDTISLMENEDDFAIEKIIDPRLRKRKQREQVESTLKLRDALSSSDVLEVSQTGVTPEKKRKLSALDRLGERKSPLSAKNTDFHFNEVKKIIKEGKSYLSDDEVELNLQPCDYFSDEDSESEEPRHRHKFTSERMNQNKEPELEKRHLRQENKGIQLISPLNAPEARRDFQPIDRRLGPSPAVPITSRLGPPPAVQIANRLGPQYAVPLGNRLGSQSAVPLGNRIGSQPAIPIVDRLGPPTNRVDGTNGHNQCNQQVNINARSITSRVGVKARLTLGTNNVKASAEPIQNGVQGTTIQSTAALVPDVISVPEESAMTYSETGSTEQFDHTSMLDGRNEPAKVGISNKDTTFFRNYCFKILKQGFCPHQNNGCNFSHQITFLQRLIKQKKDNLLSKILDFAIEKGFQYFLLVVWKTILPSLKEDSIIYFEKLYRTKYYSRNILHELMEFCLSSKLYTVESFAKKIATVISVGDKQLVKDLCHEIKPKLVEGFCWETIKNICQKALPPKDIVEIAILQCLNRKKSATHLNEIYVLLKDRMNQQERSEIEQELLKKFFNLVQKKDSFHHDREVLATVPLNSGSLNRTVPVRITSPNQTGRKTPTVRSNTIENEKPVTPAKSQLLHTSKNISTVEHPTRRAQPYGSPDSSSSPLQAGIHGPKKGESRNFDEFVPRQLDSTEPPTCASPLTKNRFWKLSLFVDSIKQGLEHGDYAFVWQKMDEFSKEPVEDVLLKRAYFQILCKDVKNSEHHISELIRIAVKTRWTTSRKPIEVLFDVGVLALINLADHELWVMALQLLKSVKIIQPDEYKIDFVLISAEIYLANNVPSRAFDVLDKSKVIRTNRDEWKVLSSSVADEQHRNKLVFILLKAFSFFDPERAVYLFKALMEDQYIAYYPIDLPSYLDKLTLLLLLNEKFESVVDICRVVMNSDMTFKKNTYKEIITRTLSFDEVLVNQVLDYATHLGYYSDIEIRQGFMTLILDMNLSEEELFVMLKRLISKLMAHIGVAVDHLTPNQLKIYLIFEDIPSDERLYKDETPDLRFDKCANIRNMVQTVLATRFIPPIRIAAPRQKDKFCKLISRSVIAHLKQWI